MKWALVDYDNKIVNLIVWDWFSKLSFDTLSLRLFLVEDYLNIGDDIDAPPPAPAPDDNV